MTKRLCIIGFLLILTASIAVAVQPVSYSFAVFGDNRPEQPQVAQNDVFRTVLKRIDAFNPAFAVNTGDCIYGSLNPVTVKEMYDEYLKVTQANLRAKVYLTVGNHEILGSAVNQAFFSHEMPGLYYSFDHEGDHFIVLDSDVVGQTHKVTGDQLEWLKADLLASRAARNKFVFVHEPLYPVDGHMGQCLDLYPKDRDALHSLFVRNRITAVFEGHEHLFNLQVKNGVKYMITGGGGAPLYPSFEGKGDFHHFVLVTITGDKIEMKMVKPALPDQKEEIQPIEKVAG